MKTLKVEKSASRIVTNSGLSMVGKILEKGLFYEQCEKLNIALMHPKNQISCGDLFSATVGMLCTGNSTFDGVRDYSDDVSFYAEALSVNRFGVFPNDRTKSAGGGGGRQKKEDKEAQMWYNRSNQSTIVPERSTKCLPDIIIPAVIAGVNSGSPRTSRKIAQGGSLSWAYLR